MQSNTLDIIIDRLFKSLSKLNMELYDYVEYTFYLFCLKEYLMPINKFTIFINRKCISIICIFSDLTSIAQLNGILKKQI